MLAVYLKTGILALMFEIKLGHCKLKLLYGSGIGYDIHCNIKPKNLRDAAGK